MNKLSLLLHLKSDILQELSICKAKKGV